MNRWVWVILLLPALLARADVIELRDGTRLEGDLKRTEGGWLMTTADGKARTLPADTVKSIQIGASATTRPIAPGAEGLASLRRSAESLPDIDLIVDRYQRLIAATQDERVLADAKADLQLWQDRKEKGYVRHSGKWIAPQEAAAIMSKSTAAAEAARDFIRQNRIADAETQIGQALVADPQNPAAHYLRGILLYRQDKLADARRAFDAANAASPNYPPTLNNLAVVAWRQNQQPAALNYYDQSMQAGGVNEYILNNAAEALGSVPEEQRRSTAYTRCARRFLELDLVLQKRKAQEGLFRWGSSWIDQAKLDQLKVDEKDAREKLKAAQAELDNAQTRIQQIGVEIDGNTRAMNDMQYNRYALRDANGNIVAVPMPDSYYTMDRDNRKLAAERDTLGQKLGLLQDQLAKAQRLIPAPAFTGIQQIVGVEGMPTTTDPFKTPATKPAVPQ